MIKGIFVKRRIVIGLVILSLLISCIGCSSSNTLVNESGTSTLQTIDKEAIQRAIEQSSMPDGGYRFATAELRDQFSVYATYYIREAKKNAGLPQDPITTETKENIVEKFLNASKLDLTDIYCAALLLENDEAVSDETKKNIADYFDSIYDEDLNCYIMPYLRNKKEYIVHVYPNYLVYTTAEILDIEIHPIHDGLENAVKDIFDTKNITKENSSAYAMLFELAKNYDIEVPPDSIEAVIQMFENSFEDLHSLENDNSIIYLPVYLMDYLDFSVLAGVDSSENWEKVIQLLCDESGIRDHILFEYDVIGLHAAMHALKLAQYDFENNININNIFDEYDSFMLDTDSYIGTAHTESNFVDTYYADALIHTLNITTASNISDYCKENKEEILESGALNVCYYLELLQRNNLLEIIEDDKQTLITDLTDTLNYLIADTESINRNLPAINGCIKGLNILGGSWEITDEKMNEIINSFSRDEVEPLEVYYLTKLIELICLVSPDRDREIEDYCKQLEQMLISVSETDEINKIMLQSMALEVLEMSGYNITQELKQTIKNTLLHSQDRSGLFKGGDTDEDIVSFRDTYYVVEMYKKIS